LPEIRKYQQESGKLDIVELAEMLGFRLYPGGTKAKKMLCIYHQDSKTPNLTLYRDSNRFFCFACPASGDIYEFYAKVKGITPDQAKEALRHENIDIKTGGARVEHGGKTRERGQYSEVYRTFIDYLRGQNKSKPDTEAMYYLHKTRLLTDETIETFRVCVLPEGRREYLKLKKYMTDRFTVENLRQAGILNKRNTGLQFIRHRIIIPITERGLYIGLKGRYYYKGTAEAPARQTYKTTAGLRGVLFNGDILKTIEPGDRVILCEGEFDTMLCYQEQRLKKRGIDEREPVAVGLLSTAYWTEETIKRLKDYELHLILDNDTAGDRATKAIQKLYKEMTGKEPPAYDLKGCKDVTDYYRSEKIGQRKL